MNKTAVFIAFTMLAAVGIAGATFIAIHRPDATATFTSLLVTVLGLATVAASTFYGLGKTNEKLDTIRAQTNGNLTRRDDEIAALREELREARGPGDGRHRSDAE
jgi:hypothetical protein